MNLRRVMAGVALTIVLASAGCKASGGDDAAGGAPAPATAAAKGDTGAGVDVASAPVSAEALCAHLKKELPRIKAVGSEVGAQAQLAVSIANLYDGHEKLLNGDVLDAQAQKTCPDTRAELLKAAGIESFGNL